MGTRVGRERVRVLMSRLTHLSARHSGIVVLPRLAIPVLPCQACLRGELRGLGFDGSEARGYVFLVICGPPRPVSVAEQVVGRVPVLLDEDRCAVGRLLRTLVHAHVLGSARAPGEGQLEKDEGREER